MNLHAYENKRNEYFKSKIITFFYVCSNLS